MSYTGINKSVYDKLPKQEVELSKMDVELGLVEDIAKLTNDAKSIGSSLNSSVDLADKLKKELDAEIAKIKKLYSQAEKFQTQEDKIWEKAKKATADLGLDYNAIKGWAEFQKAGLDVNSGINGANKYMS